MNDEFILILSKSHSCSSRLTPNSITNLAGVIRRFTHSAGIGMTKKNPSGLFTLTTSFWLGPRVSAAAQIGICWIAITAWVANRLFSWSALRTKITKHSTKQRKTIRGPRNPLKTSEWLLSLCELRLGLDILGSQYTVPPQTPMSIRSYALFVFRD